MKKKITFAILVVLTAIAVIFLVEIARSQPKIHNFYIINRTNNTAWVVLGDSLNELAPGKTSTGTPVEATKDIHWCMVEDTQEGTPLFIHMCLKRSKFSKTLTEDIFINIYKKDNQWVYSSPQEKKLSH